MTVRDLLLRLTNLNPDLPVVLTHFEDGDEDANIVIIRHREHPPYEEVVSIEASPPSRQVMSSP